MNSERDEGREREGEVAKKPPLEVRMAQLEHYIEQLPRNMEDRRKLTDHGYSDRLWDQVSVLHRQKFLLGEKLFPFLPPALILSRKLVNVTQKVWWPLLTKLAKIYPTKVFLPCKGSWKFLSSENIQLYGTVNLEIFVFRSRWRLRKLISWKLVHTSNANAVRGHSYKNFLARKFIVRKFPYKKISRSTVVWCG